MAVSNALHTSCRHGPAALPSGTGRTASPPPANHKSQSHHLPAHSHSNWTGLSCPIADLIDNPGRVVVRQVVPGRRVSSDRRTQFSAISSEHRCDTNRSFVAVRTSSGVVMFVGSLNRVAALSCPSTLARDGVASCCHFAHCLPSSSNSSAGLFEDNPSTTRSNRSGLPMSRRMTAVAIALKNAGCARAYSGATLDAEVLITTAR